MSLLKAPLNSLRLGINNSLSTKEPWQIVTLTATTVLVSMWFYRFIFEEESVLDRAKKVFFKYIRLIPHIRLEIEDKLQMVSGQLNDEVEKRLKGLSFITELPQEGYLNNDILKIVDDYLKVSQYKYKEGRVSGAVYYVDPKLVELVKDVYGRTSYTNPLHPDIFPGLCKMESEVVRMALNLFYGDSDACGTVTSGGTESIFLACKAYRDYAKEEKGINRPEMVIPTTAHAAFDKAAQFLKIKVKCVPIDPLTTCADIKAMEKYINSRTIMLVGSAPNFPYGTIDDINAISELGLKYNIPVHVDSCLGGFLTAFMVDAGYPVPVCDFRQPGVTSISADTHKYAFSPKGSSLILYRSTKFLHMQYTVTTDWPGGVYGSPTVSGSRAGGSIATCWATMLSFGKQGYIQSTREIIHTTKYIEKGLRSIKGIFIFGQPATSVIAMGSTDFEVYRLSSALIDKGWNLNVLQFPSGIHLCVTHVHTQRGVADKFLGDVQISVTELLKSPHGRPEGKMAIYGAAQKLPDRSIVGDFTKLFLDSMYYMPKST